MVESGSGNSIRRKMAGRSILCKRAEEDEIRLVSPAKQKKKPFRPMLKREARRKGGRLTRRNEPKPRGSDQLLCGVKYLQVTQPLHNKT